MFSTPAALEAQARSEITTVFGRRFALKSFVRRTMRIELHFERPALRGAVPQDYGFCVFQVPVEEIAFIGRLAADDVVEIDLDDWWREHMGG